MASNQYVNKVNCNGNILIDLTGDTVTADKLAEGYTAHDASGASIVGTATGCNYPDGDALAYGTDTTNRAGAAIADSAVVTDPVSDRTGYALADLAALVA